MLFRAKPLQQKKSGDGTKGSFLISKLTPTTTTPSVYVYDKRKRTSSYTMRRIARLPKPTGAAVESTAARTSSRCAFRCHATAAPSPARSSSYWAAATWTASSSSSLTHGRFLSTSVARRQTDPKQPADATTELEALSEAEQLEADEWVALQEQPDESGLIVPGTVQLAPLPGQIADSTYVPAESGAGLEEVGGLEGWWEDDQHWDQSLEFRGFGPRERVTDPAVLEVLARQAVAEALAVQQQQQNADLLTSTAWARGSSGPAALELQFDLATDGTVTGVRGNVAGVVEGLTVEEAAEDVSAQLEADEAQALVAAWTNDVSWKAISLRDVALKFAVS